jgi:hypothetical protein
MPISGIKLLWFPVMGNEASAVERSILQRLVTE